MNPLDEGYTPYFITYDEKECLIGFGSEAAIKKRKLFGGEPTKDRAVLREYHSDGVKKIKNPNQLPKGMFFESNIKPTETLKRLLTEGPSNSMIGKDIRVWLKVI
jgi:hypothetical protein